MESNYDENLNQNALFKILKADYEDVFRRAIYENWTICVPCSESLHNYELNQQNIFTHLLIPSDELPDTHFFTLNDEEVRISNKLVRLKDAVSVPILFTEIFYSEVRYKILCLERPLNFCSNNRKMNSKIYLVKTLNECVELLKLESTNESAMKKLDEIINQFLYLSSKDYFSKSVDQQIAFIRNIYNRCLQVILQDKKISSSVKASRVFMENVKIAVESYVLHNMCSIVMKGLISNVTTEIGIFNRSLRNLSNIQLKDLNVSSSALDSISKARNELSRFSGYNTVLGKLSCLKRCINLISDKRSNKLSVDELLPILVFLVVKSGVTTWIAQLEYVKEFNFSQLDENQANESSFLTSTLEAVLTFIQSDLFFKTIQVNNDCFKLKQLDEKQNNDLKCICSKSKLFWKTKNPRLLDVFQCIYNDDVEELASIFEQQTEDVFIFTESQYCHPLCSCDQCEKLHTSDSEQLALSINSVNDSGCSPLHVSACYGRLGIMDWLLNHEANPNTVDLFGSTPLHCAAAHGSQNAVLLLMYANAKLSQKDEDGNQPLHLASMNGHVDCVKALLYFAEHAGICLNVNEVNKDGDTCLHLAVKYHYQDIVAILLNYNANPSIKNKHSYTAFELTESLGIRALLNEKYPTVVNLMNASLNTFSTLNDNQSWNGCTNEQLLSKDEYGVQPHTAESIKNADKLFEAVHKNDIKTVKRLLDFGVCDTFRNVESTINVSSNKCHPLCRCEKCIENICADEENPNDFKKIDALSVNICNCDGFTALHVASKYGHLEVIQFLLDIGAKINARTYKQLLTPLHVACVSNQSSAAKILLDCGSCKINLCDRSGNTALHYACIAKSTRMVELLLKYEPDVNIRNNKGKTAMNESEENLSYKIMRMLKPPKSAIKDEFFA